MASIYRNIIEKITGDRRADLRRNVMLKITTGAPSDAAPIGTLLWNSYDLDAYICTVAAGTWVKINA